MMKLTLFGLLFTLAAGALWWFVTGHGMEPPVEPERGSPSAPYAADPVELALVEEPVEAAGLKDAEAAPDEAAREAVEAPEPAIVGGVTWKAFDSSDVEAVRLVVADRFQNNKMIFLSGDRITIELGPPRPDGLETKRHENGKKSSEGLVRDGQNEGHWDSWYDNGKVESSGSYFHGVKHGFWSYGYENGESRQSGEYLYGEKEGLWTEWYEDGSRKRTGIYRNGKEEGKFTVWYTNGRKQAEGHYANGKKDGLWIEWWSNGERRSRGKHKYGLQVGAWKFWNEDGTPDEESTHEADE